MKKYPKEDWQYQVRNDDTKLGYEDWVKHQKEADRECKTRPYWKAIKLLKGPK